MTVTKGEGGKKAKPAVKKRMDILKMLKEAKYASGSRRLVVYDRHTGRLLWKRDAALNFRHNNIAVSEDTIFCIDAITEGKLRKAGVTGVAPDARPTLHALDLKTGVERWKTSEKVLFRLPASGLYRLKINTQTSPEIGVKATFREGVVLGRYFFLLSLCLGAWLVIEWLSKRSFEQRRFSDVNDDSGYSYGGYDDDDDDWDD